MQEDKFLKALLIKGSGEKANASFTDTLMHNIRIIEADKVYRSVIINNKWTRIYKIAFSTVLFLVIIIGLMEKPSQLPFVAQLKLPVIKEPFSHHLIFFIISFWTLVFLNEIVRRQKLMRP